MQFAWLIEVVGEREGPRYWDGSAAHRDHGFTRDHRMACRFVRRWDAERAIVGLTEHGYLCRELDLRAVQHGWSSSTM